MSRAAALTGSLRDLPLADVFEWVTLAGRDGVIEFSGAVAGLLVLHGGEIALALSEDGMALREVALGTGLTETGWDRAHVASLRGGDLTESILDEGVDPERWSAALFDLTVAAVIEWVLPTDTDFAYLPGASHPIGSHIRFAPADVLAEAARRIDVWKVIAETVPTTALVMRLVPEPPTPVITIGADDWRVLARVDGRRSVADIIGSVGASAFTVCSILHRLAGDGIVEPAP